MAAGEPVTSRTTPGSAGPGYPHAEAPNTHPVRTSEELEWRRKRYAWLYDDEDLWAAPQP
jgi:hypothetical protein